MKIKIRPAIASSRIAIKIVANLSKVLCYGFHYIFPNKRFTLPSQSSALFRSEKNHPIPRILWQTNFTNRVTLPVYLNYLFNRLMAPSFEYRFVITNERKKFINQNFPGEISTAYDRLQIGASQADFWRLLVLHKHGGVYLDIDANLVWPLEHIIKQKEVLFLLRKKGKISNYFIASSPGNAEIWKLIQAITENIQNGTLTNVYSLTGPGVFKLLLDPKRVPTTYYNHTCNQGSFTNEYFQYIDKPQGKWNKEQKKTSLLKPKD